LFSYDLVGVDSSQKVDLSQWRLWLAALSKGDRQLPASTCHSIAWSECPRRVCAVKGGAFQWVKGPPGDSLQPEATGAVMEVTKWLKPSV
jgi:hypothetical protein